jgi:peroxiredoxin
MKKSPHIIACLVLLMACNIQDRFELNGTIGGLSGKKLVLLEQRIDEKFVVVDSVITTDGFFRFKGKLDLPDVYYVSVLGKRGKAMIFLENSRISLTVHGDTMYRPVVTGSAVHDEYETFQESVKKIYEKVGDLYAKHNLAMRTGNMEKLKNIEMKIDSIYAEAQEYHQQYLVENPASYIGPFIVQTLQYGKEADEIESLLDMLDPSMAGSSLVKTIHRRLKILKKTAVGMMAPEFAQQDSTGRPLSLSSLKGNYLLIDFWASWCGPCRRENPDIAAAYRKYHDRGFNILGVSLDESRDAWLKAIKDDHLTWMHVSDLKGWSNEAAALYGINSIPSNLLLDPDGIIIRKNLTGNDLHAALEQLLPE